MKAAVVVLATCVVVFPLVGCDNKAESAKADGQKILIAPYTEPIPTDSGRAQRVFIGKQTDTKK